MTGSRTLQKIMGITFVFVGAFFFAIGLMMLMAMGFLSGAVPTLSLVAPTAAGTINTVLLLGWIFSIITFAAGIFSLISAILLFVARE